MTKSSLFPRNKGLLASTEDDIKYCAIAMNSVAELLEEIDALWAERGITMGVGDGSGQLFVHGNYESIKACQNIILERDEVINESKYLEQERKGNRDALEHCRQERNQLKAENANLITSVGSPQHYALLEVENQTLLESVTKLTGRIEKLREGLKFCQDFDTSSDPEYGEEVRGHKPGPSNRFFRPRDRALMALSADDKASRA